MVVLIVPVLRDAKVWSLMFRSNHVMSLFGTL